jgi:hypothetical protein
MSQRFAVAVVLFASTLAGCDVSSPTDPGEITAIHAGTSFGFCGATYCITSLEITAGTLVYVEESRQPGVAPRRRQATLTGDEWEQLVRAVDRDRITALPATVGCPDCADGGAESLEVVGRDWRKAVLFEFGAAMPELQPLLDQVRRLRRDRFPALTTGARR